MMARVAGVAVAVALGVSSDARAEAARFYNLEGFGHFLDGNPESTAITEDGAASLPPPVRERYADAGAVFSAATADGEDVIVARVDDGQVLRVDRAGKSKLLWKADESMVSALLSTGEALFAGTGAPAKIYRIDKKSGKAEVYYAADAGYIWALCEGPKGSLLAVTGEPGTVVRIDKKDSGKVLFAPEQEHLRSVAYSVALGIFVGGGERGIVYRAADSVQFRALYDTGNTEVTGLLLRDGYVFAAGVSGAQELAVEPSKPEGKRGGGGGEGGGSGGSGARGEGGGSGGKSSSSAVRSQLVRVGMDGAVETLAGSSDEAIFALAFDDKGQVLVATGATGREDPRGRIYSVEPERRLISMLYQSPSRRITHLVDVGRGSLAAVSAVGGRITQLAAGYATSGEFITLPFDTGINSRFGVVQLFGSWPKGTAVDGAVRSGQTAEPDATWSEWSRAVHAPGNVSSGAPNGRYMQVRLTLKGDGKSTPSVHRVRLSYLRQNLPPFVRDITALGKGLALYVIPQDPPRSKTISLSDKPAAEDTHHGGDEEERPNGPARARQVEESGAVTLRWVAEDPNGDELRYDLKYRPSGGKDWRVLKQKMVEPFYTLKSQQLPDGQYQFRVEVTDAPSNADGEERTDSRDSRDVLIDNTPPHLDPLKVEVGRDRRIVARALAADQVGPLVAASYSLDASELKPVLPDDGVLDGPGESFTLRLGPLPSGEHTLTLRVRDEAENEGVGQAAFVVP